MSSKLTRAFHGASTDLVGYVVLIAAQFIVTPIFLDMTSASLYGFWLVILSVLAYFGLANLGIGMALTRLIAVSYEKGKELELNRLVSTSFAFFLLMGSCLFFVGLVCLNYLPNWLHVPLNEQHDIRWTYMIAVIGAVIALPLSVFSSVIVGIQKMALSNTIRAVVSLLALGVSVVLLYSGYGLVSLAAGALFQFLMVGLLNAYYAYKYIPYLKISMPMANRHDFKQLFSYGGFFQLGSLANTVVNSTDSLVIGFFMGTVFVSQYMLSFKLVGMIGIALASKIAGAAFPALSQMFSQDRKRDLRKSMIVLAHYGLRLGIVGSLWILSVNEIFVSLWVGDDLYGGLELTVVFAAWMLVDCLYRSSCVLVQASGDIKGWAIASLIEAALNVLLSIMLIMKFGLIGAAIGTLITRIGITVYLFLWIFKTLETQWYPMLVRVFIPGMKSLLVASLIAYPCYMWDLIHGWLAIVLLGLTMALVDFLVFEGKELIYQLSKGKSCSVMGVVKRSWEVNCGC